MRAYIDVRGAWPIYVSGMIAISLPLERTITVEEAELWMARNL